MARYLETATQLSKEIDSFLDTFCEMDGQGIPPQAAVQLGHIVNLAVRCNPRQSQGTVRKNIVATAMKHHCIVTMTKETDEVSGREFNKIHIKPIKPKGA